MREPTYREILSGQISILRMLIYAEHLFLERDVASFDNAPKIIWYCRNEKLEILGV